MEVMRQIDPVTGQVRETPIYSEAELMAMGMIPRQTPGMMQQFDPDTGQIQQTPILTQEQLVARGTIPAQASSARAGTSPPRAGTAPPSQISAVLAPPTTPPTVTAFSQPDAPVQESGTYTLSPCDLGFCGPTGQIGTAGQSPVYMTDGGQRVLTTPNAGGRSRLGQMVVAEQFGPENLGAYISGSDRATLAGMRNTPEYANLYQQFMAQTGDPDAAAALADSELMGNTPGTTGAWATYLANANAEQLDRARNRAAGAALVMNDPSLAGQPYVEGTFQPGLAVTGRGDTPGTIGTAFGGQDAGQRSVDNYGQIFALPQVTNTQGATGIQQVLAQQRQEQLARQRLEQQERIAAINAEANRLRAEGYLQSQERNNPSQTQPSVGGITFTQ